MINLKTLSPDNIRTENGVRIYEKIIPDSAVWNKNFGDFKKGQQYKANLLLSNGSGIPAGVTIHNSNRVKLSGSTTQAEQYTRATYPNCNLGTVRVHYYVDDVCAWQNLNENEVGWHCGDGNDGKGNGSTVAIEIIMDGSGDEKDISAEKNGAALAAAILKRYGLTAKQLYQHYDFSKVKKNCPAYIRPHWDSFKKQVEDILNDDSSAKLLAAKAELDLIISKLEALSSSLTADK